MFVSIPNTDQIYFQKTKENFSEVVSSYGAGNYRSAVVMLYATVVCDILLKLQELRDLSNDKTSKKILEEIDQSRKQEGNKSAWEWKLINSVHEQTELIDDGSYITLEHLYDYRNMSAHPAVNEEYELFRPDAETVIALIKSVMNNVLCKPPIYIKNVFHMLTDDLALKREDFQHDSENLKIYLDNKYFDRMSDAMKLKIERSLWKICFVTDDEMCNANRLINRRAMEILTEENSRDFFKQISSDKGYYKIADNNDKIKLHFVSYLAKYPDIYELLSKDVKVVIDKFIEKNNTAKSIAWFKIGVKPEFFAGLDVVQDINDSVIPAMYETFAKAGYKNEVLNFFIKYFRESRSYDSANSRFDNAIKPYLKLMNKEQLIQTVEAVNGNDQIYNRSQAKITNSQIAYYLYKTDTDFKFDKYNHFEISDSALQRIKNNTDLNKDDDSVSF